MMTGKVIDWIMKSAKYYQFSAIADVDKTFQIAQAISQQATLLAASA